MATTWGSLTWGVGNWGEQGNSTVIPTGIALSGATGSVTTTATVEFGWGRLSWGENAWGEYGDAIVTGNAMTANLGSVTITAGANATNSTNNNQELGVTTGTATAIGTTVAYLTGIAMTAAQGTADAGPDAMATGNQATMGLGSVSAYNQAGWGRQHWGDNAWGVEGTWATALVSGIGMTATVGSASIEADATVTANTLSVAQVTLGAVDPAPDAMITGNFMIGALGTLEMQGDVTIVPTGIGMTSALASVTADANTIPTITGAAMTAALGTGTTIKIHTDVTPTGFGLTASLGAGTALIWNEVNTGSAPLDPPGWVDVAA